MPTTDPAIPAEKKIKLTRPNIYIERRKSGKIQTPASGFLPARRLIAD